MTDLNKDVLTRIKSGEGINLDFKHSISDTKKIARSLSAFANTKGGSLLIGVRDNGSIAGINSEEEYYMIETAALLHCRPEVKFSFKNHIINGKNVLEIIVPKSFELPHTAPDHDGIFKAYVRVNDENIVAPKTLIEVWRRKKKGISGVKIKFNDVVETLLKEIYENGSISKSHFIRIAGIRSAEADKLLINLMLMEILEIEITSTSVKYKFNDNFEYKVL
ncbi:MAG: ATP-binding protein [Bacteroidales bacterium]|nr:ATP-binding protein [Bacteroidales bacterium]MDD3859234.1 ATP-binding protein [Bacteroidales bacterium]